MSVKKVQLDAATQKNLDSWLTGPFDEQTKSAIRKMLDEDPQEIIDSFYTTLSFGTAGLRGIMGVGSNRMNQYTVRAASQGLANYLLKQPKSPEGFSVLIGYDSRHQSRFFAEEAAKVLAGNGIKVFLFDQLRPVPLVSFGCRYKKCSAAIMITASHNPAKYNGYKVYWNDGGQVLPPHDKGIIAEVNAITDLKMIKGVSNLSNPLIEIVKEEIDRAYLAVIKQLQSYPKENQIDGHTIKIIYTSLHGTGITLMPEALKEWGFTDVSFVEKQIIPDGDFPTVAAPNPEYRAALTMGMDLLEKNKADVLIATDPDADRVGIAVRHQGKIELLNGNQIACLCVHHICEALASRKELSPRAGFVKSVVTSEMFQAIVDHYQRKCVNVPTGFKYIAEQIREWESSPDGYQFIFGAEESYGYLRGTQSRDKDAILAGVLLCEVALHAKRFGKTLIDLLFDLYKKYGVYQEELISIDFEETKAGRELMSKGMHILHQQPPTQIEGCPVLSIDNYLNGSRKVLSTGKTEELKLPRSDMLIFWLKDGSKLIVRPSGTEPKIKLYCGVNSKEKGPIPDVLNECKARADRYLKAIRQMVTS